MRDFEEEGKERKQSESENYGLIRGDGLSRLEQWGDFVLLMMFFVSAYIIDRLIEQI